MSELTARVGTQERHESAGKADGDQLTAPPEAVPTTSKQGPSLLDCARVFARQHFGSRGLAICDRLHNAPMLIDRNAE